MIHIIPLDFKIPKKPLSPKGFETSQRGPLKYLETSLLNNLSKESRQHTSPMITDLQYNASYREHYGI